MTVCDRGQNRSPSDDTNGWCRRRGLNSDIALVAQHQVKVLVPCAIRRTVGFVDTRVGTTS